MGLRFFFWSAALFRRFLFFPIDPTRGVLKKQKRRKSAALQMAPCELRFAPFFEFGLWDFGIYSRWRSLRHADR
jgi:hypothetical protein